MRMENESFDKYQERRKRDNKITKMQMKGTLICCHICGKSRVTLRKVAGQYECEKCMKGKFF